MVEHGPQHFETNLDGLRHINPKPEKDDVVLTRALMSYGVPWSQIVDSGAAWPANGCPLGVLREAVLEGLRPEVPTAASMGPI